MSTQKLVIAEKPSVAGALASVLKANERKNGFWQGNGYIVSWCVGHLVELAAPDFYDEKYAKWRYADLPIIPNKWKYVVPKEKKAQLKTLSSLLNRPDVEIVICATDSGREGELIFRAVYNYCGCKKPVKRLWISSMEESAIVEGFRKLKDGTDYDRLYQSALCRSQADWMVGYNMTRLYSTLYGTVLSVGRVQTPTLAMIVAREAEIASFVKEPFFAVELNCGGFVASGEKMKDRTAAESIRAACDEQSATVTEVEHQQKTVAPPKLYDLTTLQREANRLFGYTAQQTLDYLQSLYEKRLATYPRTDSRYLTEDMVAGLPALVEKVGAALPFVKGGKLPADVKRVIDNSKVTDHHAVIPTLAMTTADFSALPVGERCILHMLAVRLLCAVSEKHEFNETSVIVDCEGYSFAAKGKTVIADGWKAIDQAYKATLKDTTKEDNDDNTVLPDLLKGQTFNSVAAALREGFNSPPRRFTEDTLLSAMENAGAEDMPDGERRGLGTSATRAGIIERIIKSGFVERSKKSLIPTDKGISLISVLPDELTSPKLTANWEHRLQEIEKGETTVAAFIEDIAAMTGQIVRDNAAAIPGKEKLFSKYARKPKGEIIGVCPRCGSPVREGNIGFFCDSNSCGFKLWRDAKFFVNKKKELTKTIAAALLKDGKAAVTGLYSEKTGKTYDAVIVLDDTGDKYVNFKLAFDKRKA